MRKMPILLPVVPIPVIPVRVWKPWQCLCIANLSRSCHARTLGYACCCLSPVTSVLATLGPVPPWRWLGLTGPSAS